MLRCRLSLIYTRFHLLLAVHIQTSMTSLMRKMIKKDDESKVRYRISEIIESNWILKASNRNKIREIKTIASLLGSTPDCIETLKGGKIKA